MRKITLCDVWAVTPEETVTYGEIVRTFSNPRKVSGVNLQTNYSELDAKAYGDIVNEMAWIRTDRVPDLKKGDHVYLAEPNLCGEDGRGDYEVIAIRTGYSNPKLRRNPTVVELRRVTK